MERENSIQQALLNRFKYLEGKVNIARIRRISIEVELANFPQVFEFIVRELNFPYLSTITGLDQQDKIGLIYHLSDELGVVLNLKTMVTKNNPVVKSVTNYFPSAEIYERELVDLLGVKVEGLPKGERYPLTDDWPKGEFPLRKDWKKETAT